MTQLERVGTDLYTRLQTEAMLEHDPPGFRVTWIMWDSDFRNSDLQIQDLVVGIDGQGLEYVLRPGFTDQGIGRYGEYQYFARLGAQPDQVITLNVLRGTERLEIRGRLRAERYYFDAQGQPALAPGGPANYATDRFADGWSSWYERLVWKMSELLDGAWDCKRTVVSRFELQLHEEHRERVQYLSEHYPGPFAQAVLADWTHVHDLLQGKPAQLTEADLEYRELGARRLETVKQEAARAWAAFQSELAPETVPAFPAVEVDRRESVVGKVVELPWIIPRDIINDLGDTYAVGGTFSDGFYFVQMGTPEMDSFYEAQYRYRTQVNPTCRERYKYVGRIQDDPRMITYQGQPIKGLTLKVLGVLAGEDELFVNLRKADDATKPEFAGEAALRVLARDPLKDDASPAQVAEAMIHAIKLADEEAWRGLFAEWQVTTGWGGRPVIDWASSPAIALTSDWEESRRRIMGEVYDARVDKVGPVRRILTRDAELSLPDVDEVIVFIDHYGKFGEEYRTFLNVNVHRCWTLQRLDEGPWRFTSVQSL